MNKLDYILDRKLNIKLDQNVLRIIAMSSMLLDHFAYMVIGNGILYGYRPEIFAAALTTEVGRKWHIVYIIFRTIGRLAFPIFCFLLVEGFIRSTNLFKYGLRLLMLAIFSEIPFNLVCGNKLFYPEKQNVAFTLFFALLMLCLLKKVENLNNVLKNILNILIGFSFGFIAYILKFDYGFIGIILIYILYIFYTDKNLKLLLFAIISFFMSFIAEGSFRYYGFGILSVIPVYLYNGKVGTMSKHKMYYYMFYPLHLLVFYLIVFFMYLK